jgi:polysaccharide biosynthesis protein PslH
VDAQAESHFLVADEAVAIASAVLRVVQNPSERQRLALAGRERMLSHHAWHKSMQRLDGIIEDCLSGHTKQNSNSIESIA